MRSRLPHRSFIAVSLCLILTASAVARALTVFPVARTGDDEAFPTVSGNTVVWQFYNSRYDDWDIEGADILDPAAPVGFPVTDTPGDDLYPVVDGNDVVWQHQYREDSDGDVHAADISNRGQVVRYTVSGSMDDECLPDVADGVVVWQHRFFGVPDWDILGAHLAGQEDPESFYVATAIDIHELFPSISGNLVVWHQKMPDIQQPYIWGADISDPNNPRSFYTQLKLGDHEIPSLSEGWVVWRETDDVGRVMVDNLYDPFNPERISGSGLTACAKIHKHIVVWQQQNMSNGTWDIHAYNLATRHEFPITDMRMSDQVNPAVYVGAQQGRTMIVWQDNRNGNWDIYAAVLDGPEVAAQPSQ